ncbi:MAG: PASTA domain-containing protein [Prevotellaceae bacterium]|jgi:beta-lactam-binding protein with PASTA domain|nr:PASTA domain-containing protein [Prevotellaceae bacterium]
MTNFFQFIFSKLFLKQIAIALVVFILLVFAVLQLLKGYTHHGEFVEVPEVKGLNMTKTAQVLEENNLTYQIIDSIFVANKPLGTVLEQTPQAGSRVKAGRDIYITVNTKAKQRVLLPEVKELSYRQARAMIESVGLKVDKVEYVSAEYDDLVVDVLFKGVETAPGTRIEIGSGVTLLVGSTSVQGEENLFDVNMTGNDVPSEIQHQHNNNQEEFFQ